jgi:FkbM family methyltransferase
MNTVVKNAKKRKMSEFCFREETFDEAVYKGVYLGNEYRVPEELSKDDIVIDVGCHIGSFSRLCAERGAARVLAFDIDQENVAIARRHLKDYLNVSVYHNAIWKEDGKILDFSGYHWADALNVWNTGSGHVFSGGIHTVMSLSLDSVLKNFERVRIVKLDCEGSEFEIVPHTRSWHKVDLLVGEMHGFFKQYSVPDFFGELSKHFKNIQRVKISEEFNMELFWASH